MGYDVLIFEGYRQVRLTPVLVRVAKGAYVFII